MSVEEEMSVCDDYTYRKSNMIINARGRASLLSQRLFAVSLKYAHIDKKTNGVVSRVPVIELNRALGRSSKSIYSSAFSATIKDSKHKRQSLLDWRIIINKPEQEEFTAINVIQSADYRNGILEIKYNTDLTKELTDLQANYTILNLKDTVNLRTAYSFRMYEIVKSQLDYLRAIYHTSGAVTWKVHIVDLQYRLGMFNLDDDGIAVEIRKDVPDFDKISEKLRTSGGQKYTEYYEFRRRVLDKAVADINNHTPIKISYKAIKTGKGGRTQYINFKLNYISKKDDGNEVIENKMVDTKTDRSNEMYEISMCLAPEKLSLMEARSIAEAADYNVEKVKKAYEVALAQDEVSNFVGFMISAIKNEYQSPKKHKKKPETFINDNGREMMIGVEGFAERVYDYDALEKKLRKN